VTLPITTNVNEKVADFHLKNGHHHQKVVLVERSNEVENLTLPLIDTTSFVYMALAVFE